MKTAQFELTANELRKLITGLITSEHEFGPAGNISMYDNPDSLYNRLKRALESLGEEY